MARSGIGRGSARFGGPLGRSAPFIGSVGMLIAIVLVGGLVLPGLPARRASVAVPAPIAGLPSGAMATAVRPAPSVGSNGSALAGVRWTNLTSSESFEPCISPLLCLAAWDPTLQGIVVLSDNAQGASTMTLYQNGSYRSLSASNLPPVTNGAGLAFDAATGELVYFGGFGSTGSYTNATWVGTGTMWAELSPATAPSPRVGFAMAYDPSLSAVVVVGGLVAGVPDNTTWLFEAGDWIEGPSLPSGGIDAEGLAYDAATGAMILAGGYVAGQGYTSATWQLTAYGWSSVPMASGSDLPATTYTLVPSPAGTGIVAWSTGEPQVGTWLYQNSTWTNITSEVGPSTSENDGVLAPDPIHGAILLLGGIILVQAPAFRMTDYPVTWVLHAALHLAGRTDPSRAVVSVDQSIDLLAQTSGGVGGYQYNWTSVPAGCALATPSGNRSNPSELVCDEGKVGNYTATVSVSDLADGPVETNLTFTVVSALTVQTPVASHVGADVGEAVTFTVPIAGGVAPWTVAWAGLPSGCLGSTGATVECLPETTGTSTVTATVTDATGAVATSGSLTFTVSGDLQVGVPVVGAPGAVTETDVGRWANVTVALLAPGGGGPYTYAWTGLPAGCAGSDAAMVACRPTAPGLTSIAVTLTDANGVAATSGATALLVNGPLTAQAEMTGGTTSVGATTYWTAEITGGTAPYNVSWYIAGSEVGSGLSLSYGFRTPGVVAVTVVVEDSAGSTAMSNRTVTVVAGAPIPTAPTGSGRPALTSAEMAALVASVALALVAIGLGAFVLVRRPRPPSVGAPPAAEPPKGPA